MCLPYKLCVLVLLLTFSLFQGLFPSLVSQEYNVALELFDKKLPVDAKQISA